LNKEVLNFLRNYTYDENSINRLLLSSYIFKNNIVNIKNRTIQSLLIEKNSLEYSILQSFLNLLEHDVKVFDFEYLLEFFEFVISPSDKLINGAIYTPKNIREYITKQSFNELTHKSIKSLKIADIACGCGGFLIDASLELKQGTNKSFKKIFQENIFGVDIQKYSIERTKILLSLLAITHGEDEREFQFNLYPADSLEFEWLKEDEQIKKNNGFDLILGNPPYVCSRNMDDKTKELMKKWSTCKTGHPDLYIPFFQIGYELLTDNGILGFITVNTFMHSVNGRAIREYFNKNKVLLKIIDFKDEQIFKSRMTYTCICFLEKKVSEYIEYSTTKQVNLKNIKKIKFNKESYASLDTQKGWSLKNNHFIQEIESNGEKFGAIYDTKSGIATLKNKLYIFKPIFKADEKYYYIDEETPIEKGICKDIINSNKLAKYENFQNLIEKIIFPYTHNDKNQPILIDENSLKSLYPKAYHYLLSQKESLATRDKGNGNYGAWYAFGRSQSLEKRKEKLFFPQLVKEGFSTYYSEDENLYFYNGMCAYASKEKLHQLKEIMSSEIFWKYIENKAKHYASGYYGLGRNYLKDFGIKVKQSYKE